MKSIFEYENHLEFIRDRFTYLKNNNKKYSHRYMAQKLELSSSAVFSHILRGRLRISDSLLAKLVPVLKLTEKEGEYFENTVHLNQAKTSGEKAFFQNKKDLFIRLHYKLIDLDKYQFYSRWHYTALRALLSCGSFREDYRELASFLLEPVKEHQIKEGMEVLRKLALIGADENGNLKPMDRIITSGTQKEAESIQKYHAESLDLAKNALTAVPREEREISSVVVSISHEKYAALQEELKKCRQNILKIAQEDHNPDRVFQINLQLFPLSRTVKRGEANIPHRATPEK